MTAILTLILSRQSSDISLLLTVMVCSMVVMGAVSYLRPVFEFAHRIVRLGQIDDEIMCILLKIVGIGLISQIAGFVCADAGNKSLEKALEIMTTAVILCVSVPLLEQVLSLIEKLLGEV